MKSAKSCLFAAVVCALAVVPVESVFADEGALGGSSTANIVELTVDRAASIDDARHVASGVALRNRTSGTIALRGVPLGSVVQRAYLYWNLSDGQATGAGVSRILFNGNAVSGSKRADNPDPCWGMVGNHTYRGSVIGLIPAENPNQDYQIGLATSGSTTGQNPWSAFETQTVRMEGATLIVVYSGDFTVGSRVFLYDDLSASMFANSGTFTLTHPNVGGPALFTVTGADGQRGSGYDNSLSNETTTFNQVQIAGPPVAASDWDGSAGWPLPQLWDVHTHQVSVDGTASTVVYTAASDCLVPVAFVLQFGY